MDRLGIKNGTEVILYGGTNNWFAAYAYWYFRYYGHANVRLMDGGRKKWELEAMPADHRGDRALPNPDDAVGLAGPASPCDARICRDRGRSRSPASAWSTSGRPRSTAVSCSRRRTSPRSRPRSRVTSPAHGTSRGPKAVDPQTGAFLPEDQLRSLYEGQGLTPDLEVVAYCRIGERSAHTWFVLHELLGYPNVRNYDGSWTEWGSMIGVPIER